MAKVADQHLGTIRGKLGPQVFKMVNGDAYVAKLPHPSLAEPSVATKGRRRKFGLTMKLVKMIVSLVLLKSFWKDYDMIASTKKLSVGNKIVKINYPNVTDTGYTDLMQLGPDFGFTIVPSTFTVAKTGITVQLDAIGTETVINTAVEKNCTLLGFLFFADPINPGQFVNRFLPLMSAQQTLSLTTPLSFSLDLSEQDGKIFDAYTTKKAFFALVTTDINNVPVHYSDTIQSA
jgi:hypothetical protein